MSATCPDEPHTDSARFEQSSDTDDMLDGMTSTRTPNVRRLITQGLQLPPAERATLIRALLGDDGLRGAIETASELGVAQTNLRPIPGLPTPVQTLRCGSIWLTDEIAPFAVERRAKKVA